MQFRAGTPPPGQACRCPGPGCGGVGLWCKPVQTELVLSCTHNMYRNNGMPAMG